MPINIEHLQTEIKTRLTQLYAKSNPNFIKARKVTDTWNDLIAPIDCGKEKGNIEQFFWETLAKTILIESNNFNHAYTLARVVFLEEITKEYPCNYLNYRYVIQIIAQVFGINASEIIPEDVDPEQLAERSFVHSTHLAEDWPVGPLDHQEIIDPKNEPFAILGR